MDWARTIRIDAPTGDALNAKIASALSHEGVTAQFGPPGAGRAYALVQGPCSIDAAGLAQRAIDLRWYAEAIIALEIEPEPADALPHLAAALSGPGRPGGVCACDLAGRSLLLEIAPSLGSPRLVLDVIDVELERFSGYRRTRLLAPLPDRLWTALAASGLQCAELDESRVLESLLGIAHVE